ncbi:Acetyl-CoA acetyltransferase [bacterium HR24]|nr:Acetyl-CoA acetyltransferase [bacterium HR24]
MRQVAIVSPVRTPVGKFGGVLRDVPADELGAIAIRALMERTGLDPELVDDVVLAQSYPNGEAANIGRYCALKAGLPITVPGMQIDRRCASGLQAICLAAMMVQTGVADVVIAGGVESMSNVEYYVTGVRWGVRMGSVQMHDRLYRSRERTSPPETHPVSGMIETAENLARQYEIPREEQDRYALLSHRKAVSAQKAGRFREEMVPVPVPQKGGQRLVDQDEGPREDTTLEQLLGLPPVYPGGTVTAGNASQQNDGAAVCLVVAEDRLGPLGLEPMAYLRSWAVAGVEPSCMGIGPVPATEKALARAGLRLEDMEVIELNEAFAAQVLAVLREWGISPEDERLNPNGSGISLGHPIAATGARILATLLYEMRRRGARYGLETMCVGGGQGIAAVFERP